MEEQEDELEEDSEDDGGMEEYGTGDDGYSTSHSTSSHSVEEGEDGSTIHHYSEEHV